MEDYSYFLGLLTLAEFMAMCFFAAIGMVISLLIDSQKRNKESARTPSKFSIWFLLKDNWKTIVLTALVVLVTLRFVTSFFPDQFTGEDMGTPDGVEKWMFGSLIIGLSFNQLIQVWKKKSSWLKAG